MATGQIDSMNSGASLVHQVLLVEDDPQTAEAISSFLKGKGIRCITAKDGGQAHSAFVSRKPDFVILDIILPGESGFEVCDRMKQTDETVPVMVLSAIQLEDSKKLAAKVGADGYLTKPFESEALFKQITEIAQRVWERFHTAAPKTEERRVRFNCRCGKRFKVSPVHKGRTLTCPECGEPLVVPRH